MKRFVLGVLILAVAVVASLWGFAHLAGGRTDPFYLRFATPKQDSMILGTSRAAQGMRPEVMNEVLEGAGLFNFSFTVASSPYGKKYTECIRRKLSDTDAEGLFILTVDPWSVSSTSSDPNDESSFRENRSRIEIGEVSTHPNFEYLFDYFDGNYSEILTNRWVAPFQLHEDGWLEPRIPLSESARTSRREKKIAEYRELAKSYRRSSSRLASIEELVSLLSERGEVYLVRLPVSPEMRAIENEAFPGFDEEMVASSSKWGVPYLSMRDKSSDYGFTDGHHLDPDSAAAVSRFIAGWVRDQAS
ncbi:MAG: hypothetical protein AAGI48_09615 [Verrucomicrobiota bacterium]